MLGLAAALQRARGYALVEALVALMVFSLAMAGALRVQLGALTATRDTLAQARAGRLLQDLAQRDGLASIAALVPASMPLAPTAGAVLSGIPGDWRRLAAPAQAGPPAGRLCIDRVGPLLEFAIAWQGTDGLPGGGCDDGSRRVTLLVVAP
jgi:type II secretory pathway pseudopilin PulG